MLALPAAFENRMKELLGGEWEDFLTCYANDRYQALRFNPHKVDPAEEDSLLRLVAGEGASVVPWAKHGYYYGQDSRPGRHPLHECGLYYIQEPSAMSAAALLAPDPGMRVLDLCAAPGGKTTQLASYLEDRGLLIANEINTGRSRILSQNIERLGIRNCIVTNEDSFKLAERFPSFFHAILVDAPCSGEGMFRKNPEAVEEWSPENVALCATRQKEILDNAAQMLLPGGTLVYSTCTFAPEENESQIADFLSSHPEFYVPETLAPWFMAAEPAWITTAPEQGEQVKRTFRLWPHKLHGEGHYAALLRKKGSLPEIAGSSLPESSGLTPLASKPDKKGKGGKSSRNGKKKDSGSADASRQKILAEFAEQTLSADLASYILSGQTTAFGEQLYRLPDDAPMLQGLHVQRAGLQVGEFKKDRFEPSHALALSMRPSEAAYAISLRLDDPRAYAYFRGETFSLCEEDFCDGKVPKKGWVLVCIEGYSAGWGKMAGGMLKNHYPKGLRFDFNN